MIEMNDANAEKTMNFDIFFFKFQEIWLCVMVSAVGLAAYLCAIEIYFYRTKNMEGASVYMIGEYDT